MKANSVTEIEEDHPSTDNEMTTLSLALAKKTTFDKRMRKAVTKA